MAIAKAVELEGCRMGERVANNEGSPPYKRGAPDCLYEENR